MHEPPALPFYVLNICRTHLPRFFNSTLFLLFFLFPFLIRLFIFLFSSRLPFTRRYKTEESFVRPIDIHNSAVMKQWRERATCIYNCKRAAMVVYTIAFEFIYRVICMHALYAFPVMERWERIKATIEAWCGKTFL